MEEYKCELCNKVNFVDPKNRTIILVKHMFANFHVITEPIPNHIKYANLIFGDRNIKFSSATDKVIGILSFCLNYNYCDNIFSFICDDCHSIYKNHGFLPIHPKSIGVCKICSDLSSKGIEVISPILDSIKSNGYNTFHDTKNIVFEYLDLDPHVYSYSDFDSCSDSDL